MLNNDKKRRAKINGMLLVTIFVCIYFVAIVGISFYYKFTNAVSYQNIDLQKKSMFLAEQYVDRFKDVCRSDPEMFQDYINNNAIYEVVLLEDNGKNGYKVSASAIRGIRVGSDYNDADCLGVIKHDFRKDSYFSYKYLPENSARVCAFVQSGSYIVGFKSVLKNSISGLKDKGFIDWAIQNLSLVFFMAFVSALIGLIGCYWFIVAYSNLKQKYISLKDNTSGRIDDLISQLYIDPVTKLANKTALTRDISKFRLPKVILIDIDEFGKMNDFYGQYVCDQILIYMANLIDEFAKKENMSAYCVGTDRFALIEDGEFFIDRYEDLADKLLGRFKGRLITIKDENGEEISDIEVHTTIGFSIDTDYTLQKAIVALKIAKTTDKDYVCYFKGLNQKAEYAKQIEHSKLIKRAITNDSIVPYYQPIFDANGNVVKYECLIRIVDSNEIVSPQVFLSVSKRIKRYVELEKMLVSKSIEQLVKDPNLVLSINLSVRDMTDGSVSAFVLSILNKHKVADRIVFEILEDEDMQGVNRASIFIDKVKNMGAKIAIDDFGSGYSNFAYIIKLKPDYIKIDGSIIKDIDTNKDSYAIARAIVVFAKDLNIKTIAEYVHSKDVLDICKEIGVDEFQGFYLGAPSGKVL
ncbi:EAL domain-containing protein [Campylobacter sp. faydin G-24]|uniref:EAL domain-containing protein n=1 Tax=Campylobacter anatolicus TaxID=2829105 RepID=A0ABS5HFT4_9BACT|nr:GGDEF domain-containing phosphodiesterase [Campylobacter anatolicus]MBR8462415.1 EAL domain-containing protein [Campylobacter anatolicus]MBR8463136.1 EAL domain-containing protein [Campylobacter anatolicus]MBR8465544.1 EAL domain-containing protein [Campylobacter anatolicus]